MTIRELDLASHHTPQARRESPNSSESPLLVRYSVDLQPKDMRQIIVRQIIVRQIIVRQIIDQWERI